MTTDEKIARIKELVEQNPPSEAELDAGLDAVLDQLEGRMSASPEQATGSVIGAAFIGGLIVHVLRK